MDGERGPARLRLQAARGIEVPQRRSVHRGRREVQLPAVQGRQGAQGPRARRRDRQPVARALPSARAVPRFHDVLRHAGDGRGLDRAEEVRGEGRRRRIQEAADRARALQVRELHAGHRAGRGSLRGPLAEGAVREADGLQDDSRPHHARRGAEERRGRPRLHARRAGRARAEARSELPAGVLGRDRRPLPGILRPVGSEIAVARPARAAGRQPRDRSQGAQRGGDARRFTPDGQHGSAQRSSSRWRCRPTPTIRRRRSSCSRRRAIRTGSTAATSIPTRPTGRRARRSSPTSARSESG